MRVTVLGCAPSTGVPVIGGDWGRCDPADRRNRRRRVSALVEAGSVTILIDTSPDLREQLLDAGVKRLDAVVLTHAHADHLHGIDDLRSVNRLMGSAIPLYADAETLVEVGRRFGYVLKPVEEPGRYYKPTLIPHEIVGPFEIHGNGVVPFAYSTDVTELDETAFAALKGVDLWIVDCLRREPHPTHSHLAKTLAWIARVRPQRAILTHMDQSLDYCELSAELPAGVEPGYDGLAIELPDP